MPGCDELHQRCSIIDHENERQAHRGLRPFGWHRDVIENLGDEKAVPPVTRPARIANGRSAKEKRNGHRRKKHQSHPADIRLSVVAGLDPAIHLYAGAMDPRVKPAGDERMDGPVKAVSAFARSLHVPTRRQCHPRFRASCF